MFLLKQKSKIIIIIIALLLISGVLFLQKGGLPLAKAQEWSNGWAWSDTFGWFDFDYDGANQFDIPEEGGAITGYAWSDYAGWVCFGNTCTGTPPYGTLSANYSKNASSSEIDGWAKIIVLPDDEGWLSLRSENQLGVLPGSFPTCYDCFVDDDLIYCRTCYTDEAWGGSGNICSNCTGCLLGETGSCTACEKCYQYGTAYRRDVKKLTGWAWNGNWVWNNPNPGWNDTGGQLGIGWLNMDPKEETYILYPWLETKYGDIYSGGRIEGEGFPPSGYYNAIYCIRAGETITNFRSKPGSGPGGGSCQDEFFDDLGFPKTDTGYANIAGKIDLTKILGGYFGKRNDCMAVTLGSCLIKRPGNHRYILDDEIYVFYDDVVINQESTIENGNNTYPHGNGLIIIYGDLFINENVTHPGGLIDNLEKLASVGWLVLEKEDGSGGGNIKIHPSVTEIVGIFYAENSIDSCSSLNPESECNPPLIQPLIVHGSMLAQNFSFDRAYIGTTGAEQVIDDGRGFVNPPTGLGDFIKAMPHWRATTP